MKKLILTGLTISLLFVFTGCMDYEYSIKIDGSGSGSAAISAGFEESTVDYMIGKNLVKRQDFVDTADTAALASEGISYRTNWSTTVNGRKYSGSTASFSFNGIEEAQNKALTLLGENGPTDPFTNMSVSKEGGKWYLDINMTGVTYDEYALQEALEEELRALLLAQEEMREAKGTASDNSALNDLDDLKEEEQAELLKRIQDSINLSYTIEVDGTLVSQSNGTVSGKAVSWKGLNDIKARWEISEAQAEALRKKAANFTDIKGHWAEKYLLDMFDRGIMEGQGNNKMAPDATITRAEAATMIKRMFEDIQPKPETARPAMNFSDVAEGNWFYSYVKWAYENDVVNGMGNGTYAPNKTLTRQELMQMMYNELGVLGYREKGTVLTDGSTDANTAAADEWARAAAKFCLDNGLPHLNADGSTDPKADAPRAEFAYMLYQVAQKFTEA